MNRKEMEVPLVDAKVCLGQGIATTDGHGRWPIVVTDVEDLCATIRFCLDPRFIQRAAFSRVEA